MPKARAGQLPSEASLGQPLLGSKCRCSSVRVAHCHKQGLGKVALKQALASPCSSMHHVSSVRRALGQALRAFSSVRRALCRKQGLAKGHPAACRGQPLLVPKCHFSSGRVALCHKQGLAKGRSEASLGQPLLVNAKHPRVGARLASPCARQSALLTLWPAPGSTLASKGNLPGLAWEGAWPGLARVFLGQEGTLSQARPGQGPPCSKPWPAPARAQVLASEQPLALLATKRPPQP